MGTSGCIIQKNGTPYFALYSTADVNDPTVMYACKGNRANKENAWFMDFINELETVENGRDDLRRKTIDEVLASFGYALGKSGIHSGNATNGRSGQNVGVHSSTSGFRPSATLLICLRNIAETPKEEQRGGVKKSTRKIVGPSGADYGLGVYLDSTLLDNLTDNERTVMIKEYVKELGGSVFTAYDQGGNAVDVHIVEAGKKFKNKNGKRIPVNKDMTSYLKTVKQEAIALVDELITTSTYGEEKPSNYPHGWLDDNGKNNWEYWTVYLQEKNNSVWEATLNIANSTNGEKILYDIVPIKMVEGAVASATTTTKGSLAHSEPDVKDKKSSRRDSNGRELTTSNLNPTKEPDIRYSRRESSRKKAPTFYSQMAKVADGIK